MKLFFIFVSFRCNEHLTLSWYITSGLPSIATNVSWAIRPANYSTVTGCIFFKIQSDKNQDSEVF